LALSSQWLFQLSATRQTFFNFGLKKLSASLSQMSYDASSVQSNTTGGNSLSHWTSWFYLATNHEQIWLRPGETPPERAKHTIQDQKIMVTIAWNPLGFPLIVALPKGCTFNAEYYRYNTLAALTQLQPEDDERKFVIHADNARAHTAHKRQTFCEENGLRLAPSPPYSPDLAPSNFFLFGYVKECLKGMVFPSYEELLDTRRN
jgi:hypothetical protein